MIFTPTQVEGAFLVDPEPHEDERGSFLRLWCREEFADHGLDVEWAQANAGFSVRRGTLRGLHYQPLPHQEAKLVRCTRGALFDVVVDVRAGSPSLHRWFGVELHEDNRRSVFVPPGCAHGYLTLLDVTEITYLTSAAYVPGRERGVRFDDPALAIGWPEQPVVISERDRDWPMLDATSRPRASP